MRTNFSVLAACIVAACLATVGSATAEQNKPGQTQDGDAFRKRIDKSSPIVGPAGSDKSAPKSGVTSTDSWDAKGVKGSRGAAPK